MAAVTLASGAAAGKNRASDADYFAYVGSRTTRERNARGDGINVYRVSAQTGRWTHVQNLNVLPNPSYLAFDRTENFLYAVHGDTTEISALSVARSGELKQLNRVDTGGRNPVHVTSDPSNRFLIVVNHLSSSVAVLARKPDGSIGERTDLVTLSGTIGPHRVEQPFAKPHQAQFDQAGRFVIVPDKGLDQVFAYSLDGSSGKLRAASAPAPHAREGAGPRHVVFHPSNAYAYVVNELGSTVTAYQFDAGKGALIPFQVLTTLPDTYVENSRASEIAISPNGQFVYASNRGHDSIAIYAVDAASGRLEHRGWQASQGKTPRFFTFDPAGRYMFVANEDSDSIVVFNASAETGALSATNEVVHTGSPVCIVCKTLRS